jgi:RNA polymerase sigma-70 factor (ECF subfamily)
MAEELRQLLADYQDRVYNQAYRMLGSHEDAEEATQDVFLRIHRSREEFRGESKLSTWIYRITANVCISKLRKKELAVSSLDDELDEDGTTLKDFLPADCSDPAALFEEKETAEYIRTQIRSLPPKWAMAISFYHFNDMSYDEIAEAMEIPAATVATYIKRGRMQLAVRLAKDFGKPGAFE